MAYCGSHEFEVVEGSDHLACYQWGTQSAKHYFCKKCGIYIHHRTRVDPDKTGFNIGCLEGDITESLEKITRTDGRNHSSDRTE